MIYVMADSHFGHKKIIEYTNRPFSSVEDMDNTILENINKKVGPKDVLWHLGDFSFGKQEYYRSKIQCKTINLIKGNHDYSCSERVLNKCFDKVLDLYVLRYNRRIFVFSHYAFLTWPHKSHDSIHCHGHSHGKLNHPEKLVIDVGVDSLQYSPISLDDIINSLRKN